MGRMRIDLMVDRYLKYSVKGKLRDELGVRCRLLFDDSTRLPAKFHFDLLKKRENKDELGRYPQKKLLSCNLNPSI